MNLEESWRTTRRHLERARSRLAGVEDAALREYLENNELELALDELERLAEDRSCPREFWAAMAAAAAGMKLEERARGYRAKADGGNR